MYNDLSVAIIGLIAYIYLIYVGISALLGIKDWEYGYTKN